MQINQNIDEIISFQLKNMCCEKPASVDPYTNKC